MAPRPPERTLVEVQKELWDKTSYEDASQVVSTNIAGSYFTFFAFLGLLGAGNTHPDSVGKSGLLQSQFISTTSFAGLARVEPPSYIYNASKAALNSLTKTLSSEFAKYSIRANAIAPGLFVTEMTEVRMANKKLFLEHQGAYTKAGPHSRGRYQHCRFVALAEYSCYASRD